MPVLRASVRCWHLGHKTAAGRISLVMYTSHATDLRGMELSGCFLSTLVCNRALLTTVCHSYTGILRKETSKSTAHIAMVFYFQQLIHGLANRSIDIDTMTAFHIVVRIVCLTYDRLSNEL